MATESGQTVGLCLMVRNEAAVLERCLASVLALDLIDSWVVCDTGSEDGTQRLVTERLAALPGQLHESPFRNFGHNRSELMSLARGSADYLLLIDADMTVHARGALPPLEADLYLLRELGSLDYAMPRLVDGRRRWWYEGSTHEYLAADGELDQRQLDSLYIEHHADGSSREHKLLRDVGLLRRDLAADPENRRSLFYLAQTYRDLGRRPLAIQHYRRRVELGGWDEEVFYAQFQEGTLTAEVDLAAGTAVLLAAWERRPSRAEPLYELARQHRLRDAHRAAEMFARRGLEVPYPAEDLLFIHRWVYRWGLAYELALALAGQGRREEASRALGELIDEGAVPPEIEAEALDLLRRFSPRAAGRPRLDGPLRRLAELAPSARIGEIAIEIRPRWPAFNPSIAPDGDGFRMIVRTANYRIEPGVLHADGVLHNLNYLLHLDPDLSVTAIEPLVDRAAVRRYPSSVRGFEDLRLFCADGEWYASATACELEPGDWRQIALLHLRDNEIVEVAPLPRPDPRRHEKNWMPLVLDERVCFVYSCAPTVVLACDPQTAVVSEVGRRPGPASAQALRGGSQGVRIGELWLFAVHEVVSDAGILRYLHRFVALDDALGLVGSTPPFSFTGDPVEFCAGMARRGDDLVLSFGVSDAAAGLVVVAAAEVLSLLEGAVAPPVGERVGSSRPRAEQEATGER
jgi:glycosyltransferase involved in cell wall biosynthesis/predicted GH43/DUF377 family glycosyl hydrolase